MATPYIPDSYTLSVRCLFNTISPSYDIIYQKKPYLCHSQNHKKK
ncbi:hypothetical protein M116_2185 [Bacteroides fragilis str. 3719 A10]|uniref:Uncharacterized protein n=2 Tax=Bacteroides fragilis TaxID=817 RepID=A0AB73AM27_BACFG|nr:hypothetical protein M121_1780 [Bacteroides fragilis str. 3783N2-1]EXY56226.1 hypothetical protein M122_1734 [Bacteroides fragilis str. 3976T7]EXZ57934.1 hypothetical protein M116_2185 [Bacteroides fragilis str. 3719 A10]EYA39177.1 hypothetical protein M075_2277 [Bacteroides fragilis str. 20793-3]EYB10261.1 hypothetical protein M119_2598 [Bacteroides fragilis str. 3783N1-6]KXU46077.1 hypothetical protein HMPREF2530_02119 [Bacteroides fragilis]